jgi:disulfide bond formation protein DsbB
MSPFANTVTYALSLGTLIMNFGLAVLIVVIFLDRRAVKKGKKIHVAYDHLKRNALLLGLFSTIVATVGSLFYSQVVNLPPCSLCWIQRVLLFPQIIIIGFALYYESHKAVRLSAILSALGIMFAGYHAYLQYGGGGTSIICSLLGGISCSQRYFIEFGYITMPIMSLTIFILLLLLTTFIHIPKDKIPEI